MKDLLIAWEESPHVTIGEFEKCIPWESWMTRQRYNRQAIVRRILTLGFLLTSCCFLGNVNAQEPERYALLIAVTTYRHAEMNNPQLAYPEEDAKAVGKFLSEHGYTVEYLLGTEATKSAIDGKLNGLADKGNQSGVTFVGLWGHGVEFDGSDEAMFCPYDAKIRFAIDSRGNKLFKDDGKGGLIEPNPDNLVGMGDILGGMKLSGAGNRLLIADCCLSSPNRPRGRAFGSNVKLSDLPDNTAAIFACQANEQAFEDKRWAHGAMTKAFLDLLPDMVARQDTGVASILGPLKRNVTRLVSDASNGRDRQTISPILKGLPDLGFELKKLPPSITNTIGMKFQLIPRGKFAMGSPVDEEGRYDNEFAHEVELTQDYYLGTFEVTQGQWQQVMATEPWKGEDHVKEGDSFPAVYVSWDEAVLFCEKLSRLDGVKYRLPSEAEWERACRGGNVTAYGFGSDASRLVDHGWFRGNAWDKDEKYSHVIGGKKPNGYGLYDMHGNVWEWCSDLYGQGYYKSSPLRDPLGSTEGSRRVRRGGSWYSTPQYCRSAIRLSCSPGFRDDDLGFRVLRSSIK